jgi:phosphatidate cytidylyltransferase
MPDSPTLATASPPGAVSKKHVFFIRLGSTLGLWGFITVSFFLQLDWLLVTLIAAFSLGTAAEYFRMEKHDEKAAPFRWMGFSLCVAYWVVLAAHCIRHQSEPPWWLEGAALIAAVQLAFVPVLRQGLDGQATIVRIYLTIFGVAYTAIMFGFVARLLYFQGASSGQHLMLMALMVTKFSDMGAYAVGSLIGRHKMIPRISPGKTWEGFGGAILVSTGASIAFVHFFGAKMVGMNYLHAIILGVILSISAVIGDLIESLFKREAGVKDSGKLFPGIGGILDLLDSLLFNAPLMYLYLRHILTHP